MSRCVLVENATTRTFPAWIIELTTHREALLERIPRGAMVVLIAQVRLRVNANRPRLEGNPLVIANERETLSEPTHCIARLTTCE